MKKYLKLELNTDKLYEFYKTGDCRNCPFVIKDYYYDGYIYECRLKEFGYIKNNDDCPIEIEVVE